MQLNVNADNVIIFTNKLEKMHKSAFPVAVRGALNSTAFDVKKRTIEKFANENFTRRQKNFFKANSRVEMARGFDVDSMEATVGFIPLKGTNKAVDDLEQQEHGGTIHGRSFIAMNPARTSNSANKNIRRNARISQINNITKARNAKGNTSKQRFIQSVIQAGKGGHVLTENNILFRVDSERNSVGRWKITALYSFKKKRSIKVKSTHFMERASTNSAKHIDRFFKIEAIKQFRKYT